MPQQLKTYTIHVLEWTGFQNLLKGRQRGNLTKSPGGQFHNIGITTKKDLSLPPTNRIFHKSEPGGKVSKTPFRQGHSMRGALGAIAPGAKFSRAQNFAPYKFTWSLQLLSHGEPLLRDPPQGQDSESFGSAAFCWEAGLWWILCAFPRAGERCAKAHLPAEWGSHSPERQGSAGLGGIICALPPVQARHATPLILRHREAHLRCTAFVSCSLFAAL